MNPADWERARDLFERALDFDGEARAAFLLREAAGDPALLRHVRQLLEHDSELPDDFVEPPPADDAAAALQPAAAGLRLGRRDGDDTAPEFILGDELGRGAMGVVYRARQPSLDRDVAIKVLATDPTTSRAEIERFHREARAVGKLAHEGIVRVISDGRHEGLHWFAMELVDGHSLACDIDRAREGGDLAPILPRPGDPSRLGAIAQLVAAAAAAMAHAHEHGVVHRDIKPSNLLLTHDGRIKIVDFGIARDQTFGTLTRSDQLIGSLPYMSPEQARLLDARVDHRTDVYSLGVVLYELLTLERPFRGATSHEVVTAIGEHDPLPVRRYNPRVPQDLATICACAMSREPNERYTDARAFAEDLRRLLRHEAITARPPRWLQRVKKRLRRHRTALQVGTGVVVAGLLSAWLVERAARASTLDRELAPLRAVLADSDLDDDEPLRLSALRKRAAALATRTDLDVDVRSVASHALSKLDAHAAAARRTELAGIHAQLDRVATLGLVALDFHAISESLRRLAQLTPERGAVDASLLAPHLSVRAGRTGSVESILLDHRTGEPQQTIAVGSLPLAGQRIPPGPARLRVTLDDGRGADVREFSRIAAAGRDFELEITAVPDPPAAASSEMVRVEGGTLRLDDDSNLCPLVGVDVDVATFWIDRFEVSNADYRRYLAAHPDAPRPGYWDRVVAGSPGDDLPVTNLSWNAARDYAEWVGKRLPSLAEWTLAARGEAGARFPWPDADGTWRGNTQGASLPRDEGAKIALYFGSARSVRSDPDAATVSGIHHLLGNVAEWTETIRTDAGVRPGERVARYDMRYVCGHGWNARETASENGTALDLSRIAVESTATEFASFMIGFRCARSTPAPP